MAEQEPAQEQLAEAAGDGEENEKRAAYKPPPPKSVDEIVCQDQEDESLQKYKQQLLGDSLGEKIIIDEKVQMNVIVKKLAIQVEGREDIELDLTLPECEIKKKKIVLKEGCQYKVKIYFFVQREIVSGLRYEQKVYRKGVQVDKDRHMVGSYGPKRELQSYHTPLDDAPSGLLLRGDYTIESKFTDDDKFTYLAWKWHLVIKKEFE